MRIIPRLHYQAGSTSWLYVNWTSQLDVCSTFARRLLDIYSMFAMLYACFIFARCLLNVCWTFARCLLDRVNGILMNVFAEVWARDAPVPRQLTDHSQNPSSGLPLLCICPLLLHPMSRNHMQNCLVRTSLNYLRQL